MNIFSVSAVRERSGARWERKRPQLTEFVQRAFERASGPQDVLVAINGCEFLTLQPDASAAAALTRTANLLKETLTFFLGAANPEDLKLFTVTEFVDGQAAIRPVGRQMIEGAEAAVQAELAAGPGAEESGPRREHSFGLGGAAPEGPTVNLDVQPIWTLGGRAITSWLVDAHIMTPGEEGARRPEDITPAVAAQCARAALGRVAETLNAPVAGARPAFHIAIPIRAFSYSNARDQVLRQLAEFGAAERRLVIVELTQAPEGLPQSRMAELTAAVKPYCRAVLARAPAETASLREWRRCGLSGVSLDCRHLSAADRHAPTRLAAFAKAAQEIGPACVAHGLASRTLLLLAWGAGFSHISGSPLSGPGATLAPRRFEPARLYEDALA